MSRFLIYVLHHPDSQYVYVGKSSRGLERPRQHGQTATLNRRPDYPVSKWIKKHGEYEILVLENYDSLEMLNEAERFYIAYFRAIGMSLLNVLDGGEGGPLPQVVKDKISKRHLGKTLTVGHRASIAAGNRRRTTPEYRIQMSLATKGRVFTPTHRRRHLEAATFGIRETHEYRLRMSRALKGRKHTAHARENMSVSKKFQVRMARSAGVRGDVMKAWRLTLGISCRTTATLLGVRRTAYQTLENGIVIMPRVKINLLKSVA